MAKKKAKAKKEHRFTKEQQSFIDAYNGNVQAAAEVAGLSYQHCRRLMATNGYIAVAIHARNKSENKESIADRQERQRFWTKTMRDEEADMTDRLKASQHLGNSEADFTRTIQHELPAGCGVLLVVGKTEPAKWKRKSIECHVHDSDGDKT